MEGIDGELHPRWKVKGEWLSYNTCSSAIFSNTPLLIVQLQQASSSHPWQPRTEIMYIAQHRHHSQGGFIRTGVLTEVTAKVGLSGQVCSQRSQPRWVYQDRCAHSDHSQGGFIRTSVLTEVTAKVGLSGQVCSQWSQPRWVYQDRCAQNHDSRWRTEDSFSPFFLACISSKSDGKGGGRLKVRGGSPH